MPAFFARLDITKRYNTYQKFYNYYRRGCSVNKTKQLFAGLILMALGLRDSAGGLHAQFNERGYKGQ